jgi:hypothetical protein
MIGIMILEILGEINFFFDGLDETFCVTVLPGLAPIRYANLDLGTLENLSIGRSRVLDALVGMVNLWGGIPGQRPLQSNQSQGAGSLSG